MPVYDEWPGIRHVIRSLEHNAVAGDSVELVVVVNNARDADHSTRSANRTTYDWLRSTDFRFPCHAIDRFSQGHAFPPARSGVGWARRVGMDLAVDRLARADSPHGFMPCLDGDSPPGPHYLDNLLDAFDPDRADALLAAVCRYRHPLPADPAHRRAIAIYESWMRYFEAGLHLAGSPYAYQAIGSCMVISAAGYALADGVPTRRALSDFYLLQKIVKAGGAGAVRHIRHATVYPSARPSLRVPRGTGPSVDETLRDRTDKFRRVEPPEAFEHLRRWFDALHEGFDEPGHLEQAASPLLETFLDRWNSWETIDRLRDHAPDATRFKRSFFEWFDGLKMVQFAHDCRDALGPADPFGARARLFDDLGLQPSTRTPPTPDDPTTDDWTRLLDDWRHHEWTIRHTSTSPTQPPSSHR